MPWRFELWLCLEKWIPIQPVCCLCALSHICLLYWHKHIFITTTITVPMYLQAAGWPVICSVSCSLNNIVCNALIVDDILALMLGTDVAWPPSTKKKNNYDCVFFPLSVRRQFTTWYLLVLSQVISLWYYQSCSQRSVGSSHFFGEPQGCSADAYAQSLKSLQKQHPSWTCCICMNWIFWAAYLFPWFFPCTCKNALHAKFYYQRVWCLFWLCSWYFFWLCCNEWIYF